MEGKKIYKQPKKRPSKKSNAAKLRWAKRKCLGLNPTCENNVSTVANVSQTASERKINLFENSAPSGVKENGEPVSYMFVHRSVWPELVKQLLCSNCKNKAITVDFRENHGFCSKIVVKCNECGYVSASVYSSPRKDDKHSQRPGFHVNSSMVDTFSNLGKGQHGLQKFSLGMGMNCLGARPYAKHLNDLIDEGKLLRKEVLRMATDVVRRAHEAEDNHIIDIGVSYDATWHKRGHTSNYGVGFVIDILTGCVLDYHILSKHCHNCASTEKALDSKSAEFNLWYETHKSSGQCQKNYDGSSNAMEKDIGEILWKRSVERGFRYNVMLSDGDAKTHAHLNAIQVYGPDHYIEKEECLNHVSKRLGTALRNSVKEWRAKGITLGGRKEGSLKDSTITKLTSYYRQAIISNIPDVKKMKRAVYATLSHCMSTDAEPQHITCPTGPTSWCFYNKQKHEGKQPESHSRMTCKLNPSVVAKIMPVYQRLASEQLLGRCTKGRTQNPNESLHNLVWNKCPKEVFISKNKLELAVVRAISEFNMGHCKTLETLHSLRNCPLPTSVLSLSKTVDTRRVAQSKKRSSEYKKTDRRQQKWQKISSEERRKKSEGETYAPGQF